MQTLLGWRLTGPFMPLSQKSHGDTAKIWKHASVAVPLGTSEPAAVFWAPTMPMFNSQTRAKGVADVTHDITPGL